METNTPTMDRFLKDIQLQFYNSPGSNRWNSVSTPLKLWPSINNIKEWENHPHLKIKRLDMWKYFSNELTKLNINSSLDIGCASGQFTLFQRLKGINSFGIDPQEYFLYSNSKDFLDNGLDPKKYLFLGDLENFIKQINSTPFKIGCVSFLNFIHGWNGSDEECLQLFKSISPHCKYLLTSQPQYQSQSIKYLHSITNKVICYYNQIDIPRETHYLIELK